MTQNFKHYQNEKGEVIGHSLFSEAIINGDKVLALAPLCVHPDYQNKGVGTALIRHAHAIIKALDYPAVVVLGHPDYYAKFGYNKASNFGITAPFDIPEGILRVWALSNTVPSGTIQYAKAFFR